MNAVKTILAILLAAAMAAACGGKSAPTITSAPVDAASNARTVDTPALGSENAPWDAAVSVDAGTVMVEWRGRSLGDYDLGGAVSIADITPLAQHFGQTVLYEDSVPVASGDNEYLAAIDGDGSGVINIADITPIAQHFNQELAGYRVYVGYRPTGAAETQWDEPYRTPPGEPEATATVPFNASRSEGEVQRYSFSFLMPLDYMGQFAVRIVATDGVDEGALLETGLYDYEVETDTEPPYYVSGATGLDAFARDSAAELSWGVWEDALSMPVYIELAWGEAPLGDPAAAENHVTVAAATQLDTVEGLANGTDYEFAARFSDSANPPNYTAWTPAVAATPMVHLSLPADGVAQVAAAGVAPSIDAFTEPGADWDTGAPVVVYRDDSAALIYAYYNGSGWTRNDTGLGTGYSLHALRVVDGVPYLAAATTTGGIDLLRGSLDGTQWDLLDSAATSAPSALALDCLSDEVGPTKLVIGYVTGGAFNCATFDLASETLDVEENVYAPADDILSMRMAARPNDETLEAVICHGTVDVQAIEIDTALRHLRREADGTWSGSDIAVPPDNTNPREPVAADLSFSGDDLTAVTVCAVRKIQVPLTSYFLPVLDLMGMAPINLPDLNPYWVPVFYGETFFNPIGLTMTVSWGAFPEAARGLDNAFAFNKIAGTFTLSLNPVEITGGTVSPSWRETLFKYGGGWSDEPLILPGGINHDAVSDGAGGWQMAFVETATVDITDLLGGGGLPSGAITYFRNEEPEV
jgi:hypothetical protein